MAERKLQVGLRLCLANGVTTVASWERYWRRILPHWEKPGAHYFITYRLAGSLPRPLIEQLVEMRKGLAQTHAVPGVTEVQQKLRSKKRVFAHWDRHLGQAKRNLWLKEAEAAAIARNNLYHHADTKYSLFAYVIMPNHVHVLIEPTDIPSAFTPDEVHEYPPSPSFEQEDDTHPVLAGIMHSLKSYTALRCNEALGRSGQFWQPGYFDHWPRTPNELGRIAEYIEQNPVSAGLVREPSDWRWSSAHDRDLLGIEPGQPLPPSPP